MGIHEFWMQVYISAIRASNGPHYAEEIADQALQSFKRLDVDRVGSGGPQPLVRAR
jgi:hypothetical protein